MKLLAKALMSLVFIAWFAAPGWAQYTKEELEDVLYLDVKGGKVAIVLRSDVAPNHVARIKKLVREGFYDGIVFHRVIAGFMAQSGDPTGTGRGSSKYPDLKAEFSQEPFMRGTVGAARSSNPDSANSQFFICFGDAPHLNGQYTVWGQVVRGMRHIDALKKGKGGSGAVSDPDKIIKVVVAADVSDHSVLDEPADPPEAGDDRGSYGPRGSF